MDDRLRQKIQAMARELAIEEKNRLQAAGTLVDIEQLTMQIGDELARQLAGAALSSQAQDAATHSSHVCPDCGQECELEADPEPVILQGTRGEIEYQEPRCFCPRCRRSFFPGGQKPSAAGS